MKIPNIKLSMEMAEVSLARIVSEDSQLDDFFPEPCAKSSKDS